MGTVEYLVERYKIDLSNPSPFFISAGRHKCLPRIFNDLGFKVGAEIGVHKAQYSIDLLRRIPGLKLYGIDLWDAYPGYKDFSVLDWYEEAKERTKDYDCVLIKNWSHEAVKEFADESLDFVYIDGNHAYDYATQDIMLWSRKVRPGGIVCGHDYDDYSHTKIWRRINVHDAVNNWCKAFRIHPWFVLTNNRNKSWMYVK